MAASIAEDRSPKVIKQGYIKKKGMKMSHDRHRECLFLKENYILQKHVLGIILYYSFLLRKKLVFVVVVVFKVNSRRKMIHSKNKKTTSIIIIFYFLRLHTLLLGFYAYF